MRAGIERRVGSRWLLILPYLLGCAAGLARNGGSDADTGGGMGDAHAADMGHGGGSRDAGGARDAGSVSDMGGVDDADGMHDAGIASDERLFPLATGRTWTYQISNASSSSGCMNGTGTITTDIQATIDGRSTFRLQFFCFGDYYVASSGMGDTIDMYWPASMAWYRTLDEPVQEGHHWATVTWHGPTTATVPAGTFDNCWHKVWDSSNSEEVWCRGVGMVSSTVGYDAVLTSKNF